MRNCPYVSQDGFLAFVFGVSGADVPDDDGFPGEFDPMALRSRHPIPCHWRGMVYDGA